MPLRTKIQSELLRYLLQPSMQPGDRVPPLSQLSSDMGVSVGKLREQLGVARSLGLVKASPRRGITRTDYDFLPAVRLSLLAALAIDREHFRAFSSLRVHLEMAYWHDAVSRLTDDDKQALHVLLKRAEAKLAQPRVRIPHIEHRELHLTIFSRLENPFVQGLLEAYWDAYEVVELNTYADYAYLQAVWAYHRQIVEAICAGEWEHGRALLLEHMNLLSSQGISIEVSGMGVHALGAEQNEEQSAPLLDGIVPINETTNGLHTGSNATNGTGSYTNGHASHPVELPIESQPTNLDK